MANGQVHFYLFYFFIYLFIFFFFFSFDREKQPFNVNNGKFSFTIHFVPLV